jgi:putative NIF3 family GTP cyclohydrolase 1 type 2
LTLQKVQILKESEGEAGVGLGRIGDLAAPRSLSEMAEQVKETFHVPRVRVVGDMGRSVGRVAVVGGSGGGLATLASEKGADLLLTGDVHHHHALEAASQGLAVIDAGHFHTERAAFQVFSGRLQEMLTDRGWDVEVLIHGKETDPIRHE